MPKIPKVTRWTRFKAFLRGLLLYNTVYWTRASDGLKPPKATREERRQKRPVRDLTIIKPREKPRAKLDPERGAQALPAVSEPEPVRAAPVAGAGAVPGEMEKRVKVRKRRKKHRRASPGMMDSSSGVLNRIFGRKH